MVEVAVVELAREHEVRAAAMAFLRNRQISTGGVVRFDDVAEFEFDGVRIPLLDPQRGIRKPRFLEAALSIRTVYAARPDRRPYADDEGSDGLLRYKWRGDDPEHAENRALRTACTMRLPVIWFFGIAPGLYEPIFPVWLVREEPELRQFVVAVAQEQQEATMSSLSEAARRYNERLVKERVHQRLFRSRVLVAYETRCAVCSLRRAELLDAAHIIEDSRGGEPVVPNGIAMCKLHHAAYDADLVGISPDYEVRIRRDLLEENDGPTLRHSLQGLDGSRLGLPRMRTARPDQNLLAIRYERFVSAA
jgi:putative restriction endonuclease